MKAAIYCRKSSEQSGDSERRNPRPRVDRIGVITTPRQRRTRSHVAARRRRDHGSLTVSKNSLLAMTQTPTMEEVAPKEDRDGPPDSRSVDCVNWTMWWRSVCRVTSRRYGANTRNRSCGFERRSK
jgi:hypothetical protein